MNKGIKCIPFPDIKNAYIVIAGHKSDRGNGCEKHMSFFYDNGIVGAEWEPDYGPITVIYKCGKNHPQAQKHWWYDYFTGCDHWSQCTVNELQLSEAFIEGDYEYIFNILKDYAEI